MKKFSSKTRNANVAYVHLQYSFFFQYSLSFSDYTRETTVANLFLVSITPRSGWEDSNLEYRGGAAILSFNKKADFQFKNRPMNYLSKRRRRILDGLTGHSTNSQNQEF